MRIALISDIHANLPALEATLEDVGSRSGADLLLHLGDLVGYAPWPDEVVERLRSDGVAGVAGNYDSTVGFGYTHCGCRYEDPRQEALSHQSFAWTVERCSVATRRFLAALPFRLDVRLPGGHASGRTLTLVHGTPTLNTVYWSADRPDDFCRKMAGMAGLRPGDIIAFGHTHLPWHRVVDGIHFVNAGTVGRPRDGDSRAGYSVLSANADDVTVTHVRVAYDVERAASAIEESTLPGAFAHYLRSGGTSLEPRVSA